VSGRTKSEVAEKLRQARKQAENRAPGGRSEVATVGDLLTRWVETVAAARVGERSTLDGYRHQVAQHLSPALGHMRIDRLTPEHIDDYFRRKAEDGYSRSTLTKHRSLLGQAVRWGVKRRHIGWDVVAVAELPPADVFANAKPRQVREPRALTANEARSFIAAAEGRRNGVALVVALTVGLRPGELLALCWEDIDLEVGVLHVNRAWKSKGEHRHIGPPKTKGSVRALALPVPVVTALRDHHRAQLAEQLRTGFRPAEGMHLVFPSSTGQPLDTANLRRLVADVAERAGIGRVSPYDLRHTATSLLSQAGVRNEELADLLGHVDTRMVERHYRHRLDASVTVAVEPMTALLASGR
jgi:integrase